MRRAAGGAALVVVAAVVLAIGLMSAASAAGFVVDTFGDSVDVSPGDGVCADASGGCSLRAAIQEANALAGPDTVTLPAGAFVLDLAGSNEDGAASGDLDVTEDLTIIGAGAGSTTLDGSALGDRVVDVHGVSFAATDLTFSGGGDPANRGGAIYTTSFGSLVVLDGVVITGQSASVGAGAYVLGQLTMLNSVITDTDVDLAPVVVLGVLEMDGSSVTANRASDRYGGIWAAGTTTITGSTIADNTAVGSWGGLSAVGGSLSMSNSTVSGNQAAVGAGVVAGQGVAAVITDSTISGNVASGAAAAGGGMFIEGPLTMERTTVEANTAGDLAGGLVIGPATISDSTISGNVASDIGGGLTLVGGGSVVNSTFSANTSGTAGGGLLASEVPLSLDSVTITANLSPSGAGLYVGGANEFYVPTVGGTVSITNSIIADQQSGSDCVINGVLNSLDYNLDSDSTCGFSAGNDLAGVPAGLEPLDDNGGPTLTHQPTIGSPVIDTGSTAQTADQRGVARPVGPAADIGAVEDGLSLVVDSAIDANDAFAGDGICDVGDGSCTLRAAIEETNAFPAPDRITIGAGVDPVLSIPGAGEDLSATGDLDVTDRLEIIGNANTIDANGIDRVFDQRASKLSMTSVTIVGGLIPAGDGGGVRSAAQLSLNGVTLTGNVASNFGGGVYGAGGQLSVVDSVVSGNSAANGGGVSGGAATTTVIRDSIIENNSAQQTAGGIHAIGTTEIFGTTIRNNDAGRNGGGIFNRVDMTLTASSVLDNSSVDKGGGIRNDGALSVVNSTIAGNSAGVGGGLSNYYSAVSTLSYTTITGNRADSGGGIHADPGSPPLKLSASVLASNRGLDCDAPIDSAGFNIDRDGSCAFDDPSDLTTQNPMLAPTAANGGLTETRLPYIGSPLVDAIPVGVADCGSGVTEDQRGSLRPDAAFCDIGAVEGTGGPPPPAQSLVVDTAVDAVDTAPGDGLCDIGDGTCSLRAALQETNVVPTEDLVTIAAGINPILSIGGIDEDEGASGDLDALDWVTIVGGGATVDAVGIDRVFDVQVGSLVVRDITITGGRTSENGAGIRTRNASLEVDSATITSNLSEYDYFGGGSNLVGGGAVMSDRSTVVIQDSSLTANSTELRGGAIFNRGDLTVVRTSIDNNQAQWGGAIHNEGGVVTVVDSLLQANDVSKEGGGVYSTGDGASVLLQGTTVSDNNSDRDGGGLFILDAAATMLDSEISRNTAQSDGGGMWAERSEVSLTRTAVGDNVAGRYGGGLILGDGTTAIDESTLIGNSAQDGGAMGTRGAYLSSSGTVSMSGSAVTDNIASRDGAGLDIGWTTTLSLSDSTVSGNVAAGAGGGVQNQGSTTVVNSTISRNRADTGGGVSNLGTGSAGISFSTLAKNAADYTGAAFYTETSGAVTVAGSIVGPNSGTDCQGGVTTGGYNVEDDGSCGFDAPTDLPAQDGMLAPLAANGGLTKTHLPYAGSPAVDVVPAGALGCGSTVATDQRGFPRPASASCDIGAVEGSGPAAPTPLTLVVDSPLDLRDAVAGDGVCDVGDGSCTLRAAIEETNATPTADFVDITIGVNPTLTRVGRNEDLSGRGDLDVRDWLTITGNGATIDGNGLDRVIDSHFGDLALSDVTVTGGSTPKGGGGIRSILAGGLKLSDVTVDANSAGWGGGLSTYGGPVDLNNTTVSDNVVWAITDLGRGGGIQHDGLLTMTGVTVTGNTASSNGGGLHLDGEVKIDQSVIADNTATFVNWYGTGGGGINNLGALDIADSQIATNVATDKPGGGLYNDRGSVTLTNSEVRDNTADSGGGIYTTRGSVAVSGGTVTGNTGGGIWNYGVGLFWGYSTVSVESAVISQNVGSRGAGIYNQSGAVTVEASSITENTAVGARGGGLATYEGTFDITRSSVSDNSANLSGGGIWNSGSALTIEATTIDGNVSGSTGGGISGGDSATLSNSTVTGNAAAGGGGGLAGVGFVLSATVVAQNTGWDCLSSLTSGGYNLDRDGTCEFNSPTDLPSQSPVLGPLADNGGPTLSRLPYSGSPLIDAIAPGSLGCGTTNVLDQRGFPRPDGPGCDIGSVEGVDPTAPTPLTLIVDTVLDGVDTSPGDGVCDVGDGTCSLRAAVQETNAWPTTDTISITPGLDPVLTIPGAGEDFAATGDLDIDDWLTINGNGAIVNGSGLDRVIDHRRSLLSVNDLVVTGGSSGDDGGGIRTTFGNLDLNGVTVSQNASVNGGGIHSTSGFVTLDNSAVIDNTATSEGGGAYNSGGAYSAGTMTLNNTVVSGNAAQHGGGLFSAGQYQWYASLTLIDSSVENNTATGDGGGVRTGTQLYVTGTSFTGNTASRGGGIFSSGINDTSVVDVSTSTFAGNNVTDRGGGFYNVGTMTLTAVTIENNMATLDGGGLYTFGSNDFLTVDQSVIRSNTTNGRGGGLFGAGDLSLSNSTVTGNQAPIGGGISVETSQASDMEISGTDISDNTASTIGGGLHVDGSDQLALVDSTVTGNQAPEGGGIYNDATVVFTGGSIGANVAAGSGGEGGGLYNNTGATALLTDTTLDGNSSVGGLVGRGGGIRNLGDLQVVRSTLSGNSTASAFGLGAGGAIHNTGTLTSVSVTISGNTADRGAAVYSSGSAAVTTLDQSTIAANSTSAGQALQPYLTQITASASVIGVQTFGPSCLTPLISGGFNADDDGSCLDGANTSDLLAGDSLLGVLAGNGGPTQTHLPSGTSRVVDAIPWGTTPSCDGTVTLDQRGLPSPAAPGSPCDIGAVERQPSDP